jgi:hypothetical protein
MEYTEEVKRCMDEYDKMIFNNILAKVQLMLDNNRELERKMDKILLIGKENNESEK